MQAMHKRPVALLFCAAMILLSVLLGGRASLLDLRAAAEDVFYDDPARYGIQYDLAEIQAQSFNLTVVAGRYPQSDGLLADAVLEYRDHLEQAQSPRGKYRAAQALAAAARQLGQELQTAELSDQDRTLVQKCLLEIDSRQRTIQNSGYNQAAMQYNRALGQFPASLIRTLTGVQPLELYE